MIRNRILLLVLAAALLAAAPTAVQPQNLSLRNAGRSVTGNLPPISTSRNNLSDNFETFLDREGNILYFFNTDNWWGFCMGRYNVSLHRWELWTSAGWSAASDAIAQPVGEGFFETSYTRVNYPNYAFLYLTPQSEEIFAVVSGMSKIGKNDFDVHGNPLNFKFGGQKWQGYYANAYSDRLRQPVIWNWGNSASFSFGANDSGQGLLIVSGAPSSGIGHLYAVRFDDQRGALNQGQYWTVWRAPGSTPGWYTSGAQTPVLSGQDGYMNFPLHITYAGQESPGADSYLMYSNGKSYKYRDSDQSWWIWYNGAWQPDSGQSETTLVGVPSSYGGFKPADRLVRWNSEVLLINQTETGGYPSGAGINYSKAEGAGFEWTLAAQSINGVDSLTFPSPLYNTNFTVTRDLAGNIVVFYLSTNSSSGLIELRKVVYNGSWQAPSGVLYSFNPQSGMQIRVLGAVYTRAQEGGSPLIFLKLNNHFLCLGDAAQALWSDEQPLNHSDAVPARKTVDLTRFSQPVTFLNYNPVPPSTFYGAQSAWFLTQDADGYLYAPQTGFCSILIHAPNAQNYNSSKHWGDFWETVYLPGAVAVDDMRSMVYFMDLLDTGGGGSEPAGRLRWLSRTYRDSFIDTRLGFDTGATYPFPENGGVIPSLTTPAKLATGMVLDAPAGWLYVASALDGRILKYDVVNRDGSDRPTYLGEFIIGLNGPIGMLRDEEGDFYIVESTAQRVSVYSEDGAFIRAFGSLGRGPGQFTYPTQIAYSSLYQLLYVADPMNERLQVFDKAGNYITDWGTWSGAVLGYDFQFLGGIFAKGDKLWASTGQTYTSGKINQFTLVDNSPTDVRITSPRALTQVSGAVEVAYQAGDDWGVVSADLLLDGQVVASQTFASNRAREGSFQWNSTNGPDCGEVNLQIVVRDAARHAASSEVRTVSVRNGPCDSSSASSGANSSQSGAISLRLSYKRQKFMAQVTVPGAQASGCSVALQAAASAQAINQRPKSLASRLLSAGKHTVTFQASSRPALGVAGPNREALAYFQALLKCPAQPCLYSGVSSLKISSRKIRRQALVPTRQINRWLRKLKLQSRQS